ncbi:MAG: HEPN domain-containing protein [Planctomycetota bacterium]
MTADDPLDQKSTLIAYRLKQAHESLSDADFLLAGGRSPRSVINRAYYAAYYALLALLQKQGAVPKKHTGAISIFDTDYIRAGVFSKERSRDLHFLFNARQTSDYRVTDEADEIDASEAIQKARSIVEDIEQYLTITN